MAGRVVELRAGAREPQVGDRLAWDGMGWVPEVNIARPHGVTHVHTDTIVRVVMGPWRSPDFVSGSSGWQIDADGSAEFNNVTVRGTIYAEAGEIGGWAITATEIKSGSAIVLDSSIPKMEIGAGGYIQSSGYVSGVSGFYIDDDFAEFGDAQIRGSLHCAVFVKDLISAHAGSLLVTKSAGKLDSIYSAGGAMFIETPPCGGWLFDDNDIVRLKEEYAGGVHESWVTVTRAAGPVNAYLTTLSNGDDVTYHKGTTVVDYGQSGDGGILQTADMANAPWLSVFTHAGAPWTTLTHHLRQGNLNGVGDYSSDKYGMFLGDYAGNKWLSYDPTNSLRIRGDALIEGTVTAEKLCMGIGDSIFNAADGLLLLGPNCEINDGEWWSLRRQEATITGAFHQEAGRWLGTRALVVEEATSNRITNPSFETNLTGWTSSGTVFTRTTAHARYGSYSAGFTTDTLGQTLYTVVTAATSAGTEYTFSFWVKSSVSTIRVAFYDEVSGWQFQDFTLPDYNWHRVTLTKTFGVGSTYRRVHPILTQTAVASYYVDGVQLEAKGHATSYCDGDQGHEYTWSGTAHGSTSDRAITYVSLASVYGHLETVGSISMWVKFPWDADDGLYHWLVDCNYTAGVILYKTSANNLAMSVGGEIRAQYAVTTSNFASDTWHQILVTYNASATVLYLDGVEVASGAGATPTLSGDIEVGGYGAAYRWNGEIGEIATFGRVLTATEAAAIYALQRPLVDVGAMDRPGVYILDGRFRMASSLTGNRIEIDAEEIAGYDSGGTKQFYLQASDGKAMCGGGAVILDANGIRMVGTGLVDDPRRVLFQDDTSGARTLGWVGAGWGGGGSDPDVMWVVATRDSGDPWPAGIEVNIAAVDTVVGTDVRIAVNSNKTVEVYGEDIFKTEKLLRPGTGTSDPTAKLEDGCLFYRTDTDKLRLRANGAWVNLN